MDQSKYWLQPRSRLPERTGLGLRMLHASPAAGSFYYVESWEERAFAEDSAGLLGGCTWPPRSYTCSFCHREFRSAQALGGHMNVHRRDRARLKQSTSSESDGTATTTTTDHDHHRSSCKEMSPSDPRRISLAYDAEPTSNPNYYTTLVASSLSSNTLLSPSFSSSETQEKHETPKNINKPRHELKRDGNHTLREADYRMPRYPCRDDQEFVSIKRQRIGGSFPLLADTDAASPSTSSIKPERQIEVLKLSTTAVEELDLELRLGCSPNCKAVLC